MKQQQMLSFGNLTHPARMILTCLQDHPMGGRELLTFLQEARSWLEPGTLWATLDHLERAGLISPLSADESWPRFRRYDVTYVGLSALSQERDAYPGARERIGPRSSRGMLGGWVMFLIKWIVRLYPKAWRERYEDEMIELLGEHEITFWTWLDLLWHALDARLDPFYQRSAPLSPFRRLRRVQRVILATVLLLLPSALFYFILFNEFIIPGLGGLHSDYWIRNEHYPILGWVHEIGSLGIKVTVFSALLSCIVLASQGIKRLSRAGDVLWYRLIAFVMHLPVVVLLLSFFPLFQQEAVGNMILVIYIPLISLLLTCWGIMRREEFTRALPYLLPWLSLHLFVPLFVLTLGLGQLLSILGVYTPPPDAGPPFTQIAFLWLLSTPLTFAVALVRLRLGKQLRSSLLTLATVGTLGMTLVQLMMAMRLITLHLLNLDMIWSTELIVALIINVLCTSLALGFVLTLLLRRRALPPLTSSPALVLPSPQQR